MAGSPTSRGQRLPVLPAPAADFPVASRAMAPRLSAVPARRGGQSQAPWGPWVTAQALSPRTEGPSVVPGLLLRLAPSRLAGTDFLSAGLQARRAGSGRPWDPGWVRPAAAGKRCSVRPTDGSTAPLRPALPRAARGAPGRCARGVRLGTCPLSSAALGGAPPIWLGPVDGVACEALTQSDRQIPAGPGSTLHGAVLTPTQVLGVTWLLLTCASVDTQAGREGGAGRQSVFKISGRVLTAWHPSTVPPVACWVTLGK